jgi:hypothetical protein
LGIGNGVRLFFFGGDFVQRLFQTFEMKTVIAILLWFILFTLCWPIAILMIFLLPLIWLILLPFRLIGVTLEAVFGFIKAVLLLPFRLIKSL